MDFHNMAFFSGTLLGAHSKLIMDPVHGGIPLLKHEVLVIDHSLFQRLRAICQNDILSLVFPGATHSRFLHSIGVMHVGDRMFRSLVESYIQQQDDHSAFTNSSSENTDNILKSIDYFTQIIRLACLLHDCGHSSFSHQFNKTDKIQKLMAEDGRFEALWKDIDYSKIYQNPPHELEHEHYSVRCAWEIFEHIDIEEHDINRLDVLGIMETTSSQFSSVFIQHAVTFWTFIAGKEALLTNSKILAENEISELVATLLSSTSVFPLKEVMAKKQP